MSIYTDFTANSNSENSFFSVPNVIARVSEIISDESTLLSLEEELKKYYIPAFTVDFTDNYVVVNIHPLGEEKSTLYISRTGTSEIETVSTNSSTTVDVATGFTLKISGATKEVKVNPAIHADPNVKRPLVNMTLGDDTGPHWFANNHPWQPIETLFLSGMPEDEEQRTQKYMSMKSDLSIVLQIVADKMDTLDTEILEDLKSVYREWVVKIEQLIEFLTLLSEQQSYLLEIIEWEKIIDNYLNLVNTTQFFMTDAESTNDGVQWSLQTQSLEQLLETIKANLALWHNSNSNWHDGLDLNGGNWSPDQLNQTNLVYPSLEDPFVSQYIEPSDGPMPQAYTHLGLASGTFYPNGYDKPIIPWIEDYYYDMIREKIFENHTQLATNFQEIQNSDFSDVNSGTIKDWYAEEIDSILTGEESPARAEAWLANYESLSEPMIQTLKTFVSGGSGLLVEQSIIKSIAELAENGMELGDFLSRDENGNDWFSEVGSGTSIGLKSPRPYANPLESQLQSDNPPASPVALSNANYLNYALLIRYLRKIRGFFHPESRTSWYSQLQRSEFRASIFDFGGDRWDPDIISLDDFLTYVGTTKLRTIWDPYRDGHTPNAQSRAQGLWIGQYRYPTESDPTTSYMSARQIIGTNWVREEYGNGGRTMIDPVVDYTEQGRYIQDPIYTESYVPRSGPVNFWIPATAKYDGWNTVADGASISLQNELKNDFHVESAGSQINTVKGRSLTESVLDSNWVSLADEWYKNNFRLDFDFGTKMKEKSKVVRTIPVGMYTGCLFCGEKPDVFGDWNKFEADSGRKKTSLWKFAWGGATSTDMGPKSWGVKCGLETYSYMPNQGPDPIGQMEENEDNTRPEEQIDQVENKVPFGTKGTTGFEGDQPNDGNNSNGPTMTMETELVFPDQAGWLKSTVKPNGFNVNSREFFQSKSDAKISGNDNFGFLLPIEWKIFSKGRNIPSEGSDNYVDITDRTIDSLKLSTNQAYFKMKGGGLQRVAGTLEGVFKYIYARSVYHLYNFIGEEIGFSLDVDTFNELLAESNISNKWWVIFSNTVERVYQDCKMAGDNDNWTIKINHEGRIVLVDAAFGDKLYFDPVIKRQAENTVGVNNLQLIKEYANFKSLVSSKNKITVSSTPDREVNWNSLYPLEILKLSSNPNYLNSYGNLGQYASPRTTSLIRDPLCFTRAEIYSPGSVDTFLQSPYKLVPYGSRRAWLLCWASYVQIQNLLENIDEPIRSFRDYIQDLEINEEVKEPYQEGLITKDDISKSSSILKVFQENMELHRADNFGISNFWKSMTDDSLEIYGAVTEPFESFSTAIKGDKIGLSNEDGDVVFSASNKPGKWYIACIGLSDEFIEYTQSKSDTGYIIDLDYVTAGWNELSTEEQLDYGIMKLSTSPGGFRTFQRSGIRVHGDGRMYWQDRGLTTTGTLEYVDVANNEASIEQAQRTFKEHKRALLNWLHLSKGYRLDEASFISEYEQLYSEFLINNESGIFPWTPDDFDGGRPKENVETMYNVSPWLFPKNFYIDVVKSRDFRYTVPVLIKVPIVQSQQGDTQSLFQGNIKFKVTEY